MNKNKEEKAKRIAQELYERRMLFNKEGDAQNDWKTAEEITNSLWKQVFFAANRSLIWFFYSFPELKWVKLLAAPLVLGATGSLITSQIQHEANQNAVLRAYFDQLETLTIEEELISDTPSKGAIILARGRTVAALRELNWTRRKQLIAFLQASGLSSFDEDSKEPIISFRQQNISEMTLRDIDLRRVYFREANLWGANFRSAFLLEADLQDAEIGKANFHSAFLREANLRGANLGKTNLRNTDLGEANLQDADLSSADLRSAYLRETNLQNTILSRTKLQRAVFLGVNLEHTKALDTKQLEELVLCRVKLPININIDPDRDCDVLPSILADRFDITSDEAKKIVESAKLP